VSIFRSFPGNVAQTCSLEEVGSVAAAGTSVAATPPPQADDISVNTVINTRNVYFTFILLLLRDKISRFHTA